MLFKKTVDIYSENLLKPIESWIKYEIIDS
jgi:hypothetical protein